MAKEMLHEEWYDLDDLVQADLTGFLNSPIPTLLNDAVERVVEEYCLEHEIDPDSVAHGWSVGVNLQIWRVLKI